MLSSILMGLVAGARSILPLATVAVLARRRELPNDGPLAGWLAQGPVVAATSALALGELLGDKLRSAPDRIVLPGLLARVASGAIAGAALARPRAAPGAALLGAGVAVGAAYASFALRRRAMRRGGQRPTGAAEDLAVLLAALAVAAGARRRAGDHSS
ncbi:DUF4126 domain-containing protein [Aureimonas endophytica]|uniref:DUF4126 domain-containing protein n=1 Tax=Aureimonas endophytica TaxID=2027858 RepID=A0A916ZRQ7_9HYPH|nr:DUF4126 domain-containing protein [Aureimonas endophytica]GGE11109.1 DUF4126 domain-containing protein [Aureimonas endophytica]